MMLMKKRCQKKSLWKECNMLNKCKPGPDQVEMRKIGNVGFIEDAISVKIHSDSQYTIVSQF